MSRLPLWTVGPQSLGVPHWESRAHASYLFHRGPTLVLHWLRLFLATLTLLHFQSVPFCPVDRESPEAEGLRCLNLRRESLSTPAVGDPQGETGSMWKASIVSPTFAFEASTCADKGASRLLTRTRGLTLRMSQARQQGRQWSWDWSQGRNSGIGVRQSQALVPVSATY